MVGRSRKGAAIYSCSFSLRLYWGRKSSYLLISCPFVWVSEATRPCNKSKNSERNNQPGLPAVYNHKMFPIV
jgi:hypothetical protein